MVLPVFVVPLIAGLGAGSVLTGAFAYWFTKPANYHEPKIDTKGEIYNNVHLAVKENNNQNNTLVLLVAILVCFKFFELIVYTINIVKKRMKKKYEAKFQQDKSKQGQGDV